MKSNEMPKEVMLPSELNAKRGLLIFTIEGPISCSMAASISHRLGSIPQ